ncbi:hypothetical protein D3C86_1853630 [compost metagenome]
MLGKERDRMPLRPFLMHELQIVRLGLRNMQLVTQQREELLTDLVTDFRFIDDQHLRLRNVNPLA